MDTLFMPWWEWSSFLTSVDAWAGGKALRAQVAPSGPSDRRKPLPAWAKSQMAKSQKFTFSHLLTSKLNFMHSPATTHH